MTALAAITRASTLMLRRHVVRSLGGPVQAVAVAAFVLLATTAINICMYRFCHEYLAPAFESGTASRTLVSARNTIVTSQLMLSAIIALGILMLTLGSSSIGPTVRAAGGSARTLVLSESVPLLVVVAAATLAGDAGTTWFFATQHDQVGIAALTLATTAVGIAFAALAVFAVVVTVLRLFAPMLLCRLVAIIVLFGTIGILFGDMLAKITASPQSIAGRLFQGIWGGTADVLGPRALVGSITLVNCACATLFLARAAERTSDAFVRTPRILPLRTAGAPRRLVNAIPREAMLLLRHPVGQSTTVAAWLLAGLLVIGWWRGMIPETTVLTGSAMLFSAGAETAFGRSLPWSWVRRTAGMRPTRVVAEQYLGIVPVGAIPIALIIFGARVGAWQQDLVPTLVLYLTLSAIAYLSGTILPVDDAAPTALVATSLLAIVSETAILWFTSRFVSPDSPASIACDAAAGIAALGTAGLIVTRRWRTRHGAVPRQSAMMPHDSPTPS